MSLLFWYQEKKIKQLVKLFEKMNEPDMESYFFLIA